jgi:Cu+-exporting ATPase
VRNGELVPADSRLVEGAGWIDYSFVTGESEPVERQAGDYLYAGGRQIGGALRIRTVKAVSQGYLTSLWNQEAFAKGNGRESLQSLTNRYSQRFTKLVIGIGLGAGLFWTWREPAMAVKAATSVLIVACPCALALAAPFALGTALRVLGRKQVFLKNAAVIEKLAAADAVVFDKTGTLTAGRTSGRGRMNFQGAALEAEERRWLCSIARHSTHPLARQLSEGLADEDADAVVTAFKETAGCGMEGEVEGRKIWMGSAAWLKSRGLKVPESAGGRGVSEGDGQRTPSAEPASAIHVAVDGQYRGCFGLCGELRPNLRPMLDELAAKYELALLSGDTEKERARFEELFGSCAELRFNQSPLEKLRFIQSWQSKGRAVVMVGDGLNDAGALRQSDIGIAVVEDMSTFSPASDVILGAERVPGLGEVFRFTRRTVGVVRASFVVSALYNAVGISIAATGGLSPVVCAILMPLSSVTVVAIACGLTSWFGRTQP